MVKKTHFTWQSDSNGKNNPAVTLLLLSGHLLLRINIFVSIRPACFCDTSERTGRKAGTPTHTHFIRPWETSSVPQEASLLLKWQKGQCCYCRKDTWFIKEHLERHGAVSIFNAWIVVAASCAVTSARKIFGARTLRRLVRPRQVWEQRDDFQCID